MRIQGGMSRDQEEERDLERIEGGIGRNQRGERFR
jgi:hypothetical protein